MKATNEEIIDKSFADFFPDEKIRPFAYLLSRGIREGNICITIPEQPTETPFGKASVRTLEQADRNFWAPADASVPFIYHKPHLYLQRYFRYETTVIGWMKERIAQSEMNKKIYRQIVENQGTLIRSLAADYPTDGLAAEEKTDWKLVAVIQTLLNDFSIITGGPGTGKTTTLAKLLLVIFTENPETRVALAAPTGKASMRMLESLRQKSDGYPDEIKEKIRLLKPYTLHRLLGYQRNSIYFRHNREKPLQYDWVIVDEASMIDLPMFAKLLAACSPATRLLLLGDKDQLASVEAGSLFGDLCMVPETLNRFPTEKFEFLNKFIADPERRISKLHEKQDTHPLAGCITGLKLSHRFKQQGAIGKLSLALNGGQETETLQLLREDATGQIRMIADDQETAFQEFIEGYGAYLGESDIRAAFKELRRLRVLVTVREGGNGLYAMNRNIEKVLSRKFPKLIQPTAGFYHNQPIIVTANNYELGLFNGDIGIVRKDSATGQLRVWFEAADPEKVPDSYSPASLNDYETVFAMTIHKSQGSEFDKVMVVLPDKADSPLLTRELLYTGVTRAITQVVIRGSEAALLNGTRRRVSRISGIQTRLTP